jgi:hypothetical protein
MTTLITLLSLYGGYLLLYHTKLGKRIMDFIINGLNDF